MSFIGNVMDEVRNKAPVSFAPASRTSGFMTRRVDRKAQLQSMEGVSTLFSVVDAIAQDVSRVNWKLYRSSESGLPEDRERVTSHAALTVWNKPNDFYTQQEFVEAFMQHLELTGETEWLVARDPRVDFPLELWPIRPDRMEPVPSKTDFLAGWLYKDFEGGYIPLGTEEVIQVRRPHPLDPYRGFGAVQTLLVTLESSKFSEEWNRNFFRNSAEPGGVIQVEKRLTDDEFNEMRDRWNENHRGVSRAHRVAIVEQGEWKQVGFSMREMQFVQLAQFGRDKVMEAWRIHKHMLGISDDVNRANAEAADTTYANRLLVPRLERIRQALNSDFLPMFGSTGQGLEFDFDNPVPADRQTDINELTAKTNAASALVTAGWEPQSVLSALGLPAMNFVGRQA